MTAEDPRVQTIRDGLDAYWDPPSEFHSALDSLAADLEAAREALNEIDRTEDGWAECRRVAGDALARLSAGKETSDE